MPIAKKTYYTDYAVFAWRWFLAHPEADDAIKSRPCHIANWNACKLVWDKLNEIERAFLREVYTGKDTIPDNVYELSRHSGTSQDDIWKILRGCEARFARERGLT